MIIYFYANAKKKYHQVIQIKNKFVYYERCESPGPQWHVTRHTSKNSLEIPKE